MGKQDNEKIKFYASRANEVEPTKALGILCDIYIENCGISLGTRTVAENAIFYWTNRWREEKPDLTERIGLHDVLSLLSDEYKENKEFIDKYDVTILDDEELSDICSEMIEETSDETTRIALCAGVQYILDLPFDW